MYAMAILSVVILLQGAVAYIIPTVTESGTRYTCSLCGANYKWRFHTRSHIRDKHSNTKFKCPFCSYTSGRKFCIKQHVRNIHKDADPNCLPGQTLGTY